MDKPEHLKAARTLMDEYARRTGLTGLEGDSSRRYLWTDAFAVQNFFALAKAYASPNYRELALKLIDEVHFTLGRHHPGDEREGWISSLPEEEGREHPTAGGLRIGKKLPERKPGESFDERLEWERDGQYFHYLTKWMDALLQATGETYEKQYAVWAAELLLKAGTKFMVRAGDDLHMYWKMNTGLSGPLVPSMGMHDPMEGLICALGILQTIPEKAKELHSVIMDLKELCAGRDWYTIDALGIGILLLNTCRVAGMESADDIEIPKAIKPQKLWEDSLSGLENHLFMYDPNGRPANDSPSANVA